MIQVVERTKVWFCRHLCGGGHGEESRTEYLQGINKSPFSLCSWQWERKLHIWTRGNKWELVLRWSMKEITHYVDVVVIHTPSIYHDLEGIGISKSRFSGPHSICYFKGTRRVICWCEFNVVVRIEVQKASLTRGVQEKKNLQNRVEERTLKAGLNKNAIVLLLLPLGYFWNCTKRPNSHQIPLLNHKKSSSIKKPSGVDLCQDVLRNYIFYLLYLKANCLFSLYFSVIKKYFLLPLF